MKWISTKQEHPPNNTLVLVAATQELCKSNICKNVRMSTARTAYYLGESEFICNFKYAEITHWMKIPDLPNDMDNK